MRSSANLTGFQPSKVEDVQLQLGQILKVNFALQIGGVSEAVQVTAESPLIDVKQNAASREHPEGHHRSDPQGAGLHERRHDRSRDQQRNARRRHQDRRVERLREPLHRRRAGHDHVRNGTSQHARILIDFVQEVQVKSSGYNAEFRAATGGVISAITRSGTNVFHGEFGVVLSRTTIRLGATIRQSLAARSAQPAHRAVHDHRARPRPGRRAVATHRRPDPDATGSGSSPATSRSSTNNKRTVTFTQNRAAGAADVFEQPAKITTSTTTSRRSSTSSLHQKFAGSHKPTTGRVGLPGLEPDYISARPASSATASRTPHSARARPTRRTFPGVLYTNQFNNRYASTTDWVVSPEAVPEPDGRLSGLRLARSDADGVQHRTRARTFSQSNNVLSRRFRPTCMQPNGYADGIANTRTAKDDYARLSVNADATYYANWKGSTRSRAASSTSGSATRSTPAQQAPNMTLNWNQTRTTLDLPPRLVRGTYGYYQVFRAVHRGQGAREQLRRVPPGRLDGEQQADAEPGPPQRTGRRPVVPAGESRDRLRLQGQDRAARRLRVRREGRRQVEGLRQLGHVLRHQQARDAARQLRRRALDHLLLHARHVQLAVDQLRRARREPAARARSSSRWISGTCRTASAPKRSSIRT